jgi:hypothetical protein
VWLFSAFALPLASAISDSPLKILPQLAVSSAGVAGVYGNITTDLGVLSSFAEAQLYHATLNDTSFPTNILLNVNFNSPERFAP